MPEEFEGDLAGAEFWGADLTGATFRDVNLTDATISHAWLINVNIDALVDRLVINGVDVTTYVNEHDPWYPLRGMLRPTTTDAMLATTDALEAEWAENLRMAASLPAEAAHQSVGGEWSLVHTIRHLVFAIDKWFTAPVLGQPLHPMGLPNTGSREFPWPGLQYDLEPSLDEALAVHADRLTRFRNHVRAAATADLERSVDILENGPHPVLECIYTVFEEEFWHLRYARRDLSTLVA